MPSNKKDLLSSIDQNLDAYVKFLQQFIQTPSPNPPGDTRNAADVVIDFLKSQGIDSRVIAPKAEKPNVVSEFTGGAGDGPRVILNGHIDHFPVGNAADWERDPYSGFNDGKAIHGVGGVDMKAGTAASIIAFALLHKRRESLKGSVVLTAVSDEETGGKWGTKYLLENFGETFKGDVVLNGEPGGLQSVRFGEKGTLRLTFTVRTEGANGAYTHLTRGANIVAAKLIERLLSIEKLTPDTLPEELKRHFDSPEARKAADEIMGTGASDILLKPTVNVGVIQGGAKVNTIPVLCRFEADIRLPIGMLAEHVLSHIDTILEDFPEAEVEKQDAASNPANYCTKDHPLLDAVVANAAEVTGRRPVPLIGLGGTDCKFWRYAGVPAFVFGPSPKGMGANGEAVEIEEFRATVKTHAAAVWDYLGGCS